MRSIRTRLVIIYLALVFIVMAVSTTFILIKFRSDESKSAERELQLHASKIEDSIISQYSNPQDFQDALQQSFSGTGSLSDSIYNGIQSAIISSKGDFVIAGSEIIQNTSIPVIISAVNGKESFTAFRQDITEKGLVRELFEFAKPVNDENGSPQYIIYVKKDASLSKESLGNMALTQTAGLMIAMILTVILGVLFANTLTKPIIALTVNAKEVARGNFNVYSHVYSDDEIGQLTESFNFMTHELKANLDSISTEKNKLEIVLHNMTDGVLSFDENGNLDHINNSGSEFLRGINFPNQLTLENLLTLFNIDINTLDMENQDNIIVEINNKFYNFNLARYKTSDDSKFGTVIVLQDVTKQKKLEDMRKEFVANVSHELRTPLTTIKSYTESLLDGAVEEPVIASKFLNTINDEADRMTFLVKDLLDLSKFDSKKMELKYSEFDLIDLIQKSIIQSSILANKKNQIIEFDNNSVFMLNGDKGRINQVIINFLSNAIKYSKENTSIYLSTAETEDFFNLYIRDNGMGISKEDLSRIFERFYRVDKARSREMGGTGLGLAISKEIMEMHGGKIKAVSEIGTGTTMILSFKKNNTSKNLKE